MPDSKTQQDSSTRVQITVAIIGLVGVIAAALISNWSSIFPKPAAQPATVSSPASVTGTGKTEPKKSDPAIHSSGQLEIRGTFSYDLDAGVQSADGADLFWDQQTAVKRSIDPLNGASFFVVGIRDFDSVTYADLKSFSYSVQKIDGSNLPSNLIPQGTVVAYKTNEGRLGKFVVDQYSYNFSIRWITYDN